MDKKSLSERDICTKFIAPAIQQAGWDIQRQVREEVSFTKGRIIVQGKLHTRGSPRRADFILYYQANLPLVVIEAKDNKHSVPPQHLARTARHARLYAASRMTVFNEDSRVKIPALRPISADVSGFALQTVFADVFVKSATASSTGSKMPRADWKVMKAYAVAVPDKTSNVLSRYQSMFGGTANKIELHVEQNHELTQLRDWLLPLLTNGQVRVA